MAPHSPFTAIHVQAGLHRVTMGLRNRAASIPKIKVDFSKVPDWTRRAARLSIAVIFFGILGHCAQFPPEYQMFASNFRQSCNWAAITCIVVTAPLIGKVAQVAFDRLLGTAVGGFIGCVCFTLGPVATEGSCQSKLKYSTQVAVCKILQQFHVFGAFGGGIFISLMSGVTIWGTTYLAFKHSLDQLVRFVQLTYIIVAFGAKPDKVMVSDDETGGLSQFSPCRVYQGKGAIQMSNVTSATYQFNQCVYQSGAFLLALLRVGGIFAGGLLSVLLAVVVLPRSASIDCLLEMKKALKALYDLNQEVWTLSGVTGQNVGRRSSRKPHRHGYSALHQRLDAAARARGSAPILPTNGSDTASFAAAAATAAAMHPSASDPALCTRAQQQQQDLRRGGAGGCGSADSLTSFNGVGGGGGGLRKGLSDTSTNQLDLLVQHDEERDSREAAVEKLFTAVYTALGRVDEHLAQTRGEIYIWHFWGRYFFLPGVHWFPVRGRWQVPKKDLEGLATCVRRVARMLWTLLLDFEEGFGSEMEAVLRLYYPKQLLSELADYQARAILDLLRAFPGATTIEVDNLLTLGQVTDCLMQISDARARNAIFNMKRRRTGANTNTTTNNNTTTTNNNSAATAKAAGTPALVATSAVAAAASGGCGTPQHVAATSRAAAERRMSLEMRISRWGVRGVMGAGGEVAARTRPQATPFNAYSAAAPVWMEQLSSRSITEPSLNGLPTNPSHFAYTSIIIPFANMQGIGSISRRSGNGNGSRGGGWGGRSGGGRGGVPFTGPGVHGPEYRACVRLGGCGPGQVRWFSFQFVMDEMVNELEEAFHACSAVLQKLPYPIGN
ncbi:hypothetical protein VOLCADRAFT_90583 [Volvox carteri f. nagariensis]|uniref:Uncharacterized protein n=1 Tax=Volvox carteri f. nagariensis TaxID=3068 RepID=D8TUT0_VOLCA|nr:uncharacterized protein VOLCADRAFT_90583 [Volvox carteri f. nagariensis]EFJ48876.1 hypothetical protein VOLCADRAFT_90583 [Volvox carteri f. nagariensis]|eukprot:XP_002950208.1 hypothetical protein VOLCADRAFT_90583 [Volvox carteri f. nagariensis]